MPGPVPKRSDQRRRRNQPEGVQVTSAPAGSRPRVPRVDPSWHDIAKDWFRSLARSGQAQFYEASDWQTARYVAEAMSRNLNGGSTEDGAKRFSAQLFQSVMAAMTDLLTTEGARRRARVELERNAEPAALASVSAIDRYRKAAGQ